MGKDVRVYSLSFQKKKRRYSVQFCESMLLFIQFFGIFDIFFIVKNWIPSRIILYNIFVYGNTESFVVACGGKIGN